MNKLYFLALCFATFQLHAQSFAPNPGQPGTTAIPKDSSCFIGWATGGEIVRGYIDINDTTAEYDGSNRATFGELENAFGPAQGTGTEVVSLGDSGYVTLTFAGYVMDGPGWDFAVFENGFADDYLELAHVEVSSDGVHFFRFPSTSEIPLDEQSNNGTFTDCRYIDNLAGKYRAGFGTPFDLADLPANALLNPNAVTHIRIVDVIGSIATSEAHTTDQFGTVINDPYPTPFHSGGFDLDAVGVIHATLAVSELHTLAAIGPNPTQDKITITAPGTATITLRNMSGQLVTQFNHTESSSFSFANAGLSAGVYLLQVQTGSQVMTERVVFGN